MAHCTLKLLGTGTSDGIPMLGCDCAVCRSADPANHRLRTSAAIIINAGKIKRTIIIDTGLDFRQQLLRSGINNIDTILYTHSHADHVEGITELRPLSRHQNKTIPCYGNPETINAIKERFAYIFSTPQEGGGLPSIELIPVVRNFSLFKKNVVLLPVNHGKSRIYGYRFGDLAFITDASNIPGETMEKLQGVKILILNALRYTPHSTHFSVAEATRIAEEVGARITRFVHLSHMVDHNTLQNALPSGIAPGRDGETIRFNW